MSNSQPQTLWQQALSELELQMTHATFDTWLRGSECSAYDADSHVLTVAVKNNYAVEWLENRLYSMIDRTLKRITGNGVSARFIVPEEPPRQSMGSQPESIDSDSDPDWHSPDFDPSDTKKVAGWIPLPEYATLFWAPLLGAAAWRIWEIVRRSDKRAQKTEFTPALRYSIPQLARLVPCARQSITGRNIRCDPDYPGAQLIEARGGRARLGGESEKMWVRRLPGALDFLQREGVATVERSGARKSAVVILSVRVNLPLLHPAQLDHLPPDIQAEHDRWLSEHGLDPEDWQ